MKRLQIILFSAFLLLSLGRTRPHSASAQEAGSILQSPVVRAVMFWMEGCPHCHYVLEEVLPPLQEKYGDQLQIQLIEMATAEDVDRLYQTAAAFKIPKEQVGLPFLIIGDRALSGSDQIPVELPGLIEEHLTAGGLDYPDVPGLAGILSTTTPETEAEVCAPSKPCAGETTPWQETATTVAVAAAVESQPQEPLDRTAPRSNGFALAIGIMVGMVASLGYAGVRFVQGSPGAMAHSRSSWLEFATPVLALLGLGVAGYLAYVETQAVSAVCGPVGDCNAVQSSPYARIFGVLPVGVMGMLGYLAILVAWLWGRLRQDRLAVYAPVVIFGLALFGTLLSLYLTFLEPFVIKAVCVWCLTSAVIITLLMLLSMGPSLQAFRASDE